MLILYHLGLRLFALGARVAALFSGKAAQFVDGRHGVLAGLRARFSGEARPVVWVHCASLGEFEQGRPVMEHLKRTRPEVLLLLTFFSPSGYEVRKEYAHADYVCYLPLDIGRQAPQFVDIVRPQCALFVKYEFWYHYLEALHDRDIPVILFSAFFQPNQIFFKWYGGLHRKMLTFYQQIFVQDESSRSLLQQLGSFPVQVAGDTRFDRCIQVLRQPKAFPKLNVFKGSQKLIVAGSTWPDDEQLLRQAFARLSDQYKLLLVPHEVSDGSIRRIKKLFPDSCAWDAPDMALSEAKVAFVPVVGFLSFVYRYADVAWIGGGFTKSGIHNIIEPSVFGIPVFFGPNYRRFREALEMIAAGAVQSVADETEFLLALNDESGLSAMRQQTDRYVASQLGATEIIAGYVEAKCLSTMA